MIDVKLLIVLIMLASTTQLQARGPVAIPDSTSPGGAYSLYLTEDREKGSDTPVDVVPDVQIVKTKNKVVLASFPFSADPNSDLSPLRTKVRAYWNDDATAVAVTFCERFYTGLVVYQLRRKKALPDAFVPVTLPGSQALIKAMIPRFREFRSRWHDHVIAWADTHVLRYSSGTDALIQPLENSDVNFPARYTFTVDLTDPATPVIQKIERDEDARR